MIRETLRAHLEIAIVLALFVALGIVYSTTTPLFEAPDEQWHFAFAQYVAMGHGLPVQSDPPTHLARQEGSQPPLYYLLAAGATFWIDTSDYPGIVWENPHYGYNVPGIINDNKNLFLHTSLENFPYRGTVLAIYIARLLSLLMGVLSVLFTYLLALAMFPAQRFLAASASAVVAFVPQFLFVSSAVSNDSTIVAMAALALWLMARLLTAGDRLLHLRDAVALGVACGLAALAKVSGLSLFALAALVIVWRLPSKLRIENRKSEIFLHFLLFIFAFLVVAGWWYVRNLLLYGELTGTAMMSQIFYARQAPLTLAELGVQLHEVWETFWVGFGWGNIRANPMIYAGIVFFVALSIIGWLLAIRNSIFKVQDSPSAIRDSRFAILFAWIGLMLATLVYWMETTQAPHGRLLFPALPALAVLIAFGLAQFQISDFRFQISRIRHMPLAIRHWPLVHLSFVIFLFALAALAPFFILQPAYAFPQSLNAVPNTIRRVDINYGDQMKLLGYAVSARRALPGDAVTLTLYWQSLAVMEHDYSIGIHLLDAQQRVIGARDSYPGHGMLPTRLWSAGQTIRDVYWLPVDPNAMPGVAQIQVSLYTRENKRDLPARDPNGQAITPIIGQIEIASTTAPAIPQMQYPLDLSFGEQAKLIGYDIRNTDALDLMLYWQSRASIADDYTVFVHVLDSNDRLIAQHDQLPANGSNPTSLWSPGEVIADRHQFALPGGALGVFHIQVGLYRADTGARLSITDSRGNAVGDAVVIGSFGVLP